MKWTRGMILPLLGTILLALAACQPITPRLATATAQAQMPSTPTPESLVLPAPASTAIPTAQPQAAVATNPRLTVWINETSPEHRQALNQMAADFSEMHQIDVELMLVAPSLLPKLMETAVISDAFSLPDIVLHPIEYTVGWAERGILDTAVTHEVVDAIGRDTFNPEALTLVESNGLTAAIPSDAYPQIVVYRADWVEELGLAVPDNPAAMLALAEASAAIGPLVSGFVIPTESNLTTTHQAFEQIAQAYGCQLIDEKGEVLILEPACQSALDFYFEIVHNYSPTGVQTDTSARNAYLAGRTGLIISSPSILPALAGLNDDALPRCAECGTDSNYLAQNSGVITHVMGDGTLAQASNLSEMTYLGITSAAERETAVAFATYWFNEGYADWLAVESERKVPLRWGAAEQPRQFIDGWGDQPLTAAGPSLRELYGDTLVGQLREAASLSSRWGLAQGQGGLVAALNEELTLSVTLQEMLSGYFSPGQTLTEAYARIVDLIPNYSYDIDVNPDS